MEQTNLLDESLIFNSDSNKLQKGFEFWFEKKFQSIKAFTQDLKQPHTKITEKEDQDITNYTIQIIKYLSYNEALSNQKLYRNALVGLGNFLSIKFSFLKKQFLSQNFFKNLIGYFGILCQNQGQPNFNSLVYPIFYLIVLIIYNSDKEMSKTLYSSLFIKKFLRNLSLVSFVQGNRIQRYLPVIIAFVAKGISNCENSLLLKKIILNNIHFARIQKNYFHFVYSLRILINKESFTMAQIKKYQLIDYLSEFLIKSSSQQQVTMTLEILKHILKRHQILGYKMIQKDIISILQKSYILSSEQTINFFQILSPCLPYILKQQIFTTHTLHLQLYQSQSPQKIDLKHLQSIKIITNVVHSIQFQKLGLFLESYSLEILVRAALNGEYKLESHEQNTILGFFSKILKTFNKVNHTLVQYYLNSISSIKNKKLQAIIQAYSIQSTQSSQNQLYLSNL